MSWQEEIVIHRSWGSPTIQRRPSPSCPTSKPNLYVVISQQLYNTSLCLSCSSRESSRSISIHRSFRQDVSRPIEIRWFPVLRRDTTANLPCLVRTHESRTRSGSRCVSPWRARNRTRTEIFLPLETISLFEGRWKEKDCNTCDDRREYSLLCNGHE